MLIRSIPSLSGNIPSARLPEISQLMDDYNKLKEVRESRIARSTPNAPEADNGGANVQARPQQSARIVYVKGAQNFLRSRLAVNSQARRKTTADVVDAESSFPHLPVDAHPVVESIPQDMQAQGLMRPEEILPRAFSIPPKRDEKPHRQSQAEAPSGQIAALARQAYIQRAAFLHWHLTLEVNRAAAAA